MIKREGIFLFDRKEKLIKAISPNKIMENVHMDTINGLITSTVTIAYDEAINSSAYFGAKDPEDPEIFWMYKIANNRKEGGNLVLDGVHVLFDDLKGKPIRDKKPRDATPAQAFNSLLEDTRWTVGRSTATHKTSANFYFEAISSAFFSALEIWKCEFRPRLTFSNGKITGRYIDLYDQLSDDYGKWFEYGDKLLTVTAETSEESLYTAFIGRGRGVEVLGEDGQGTGDFGRKLLFTDVSWSKANGDPLDKALGQDYIEIPEATAAYGYPDGTPRIGIIDFDDIEDPNELLQATYDYAVENSRPKLELKSSALWQGKVEIGETCAIIRPDIGIRYKTRIFSITRDFLNAQVKSFEIGDKIRHSEAQRIKAEEKKQKARDELIESRMETIIEEITSSYWGEDGYTYDLKIGNEYGLPAGIYSFNRPIDQNPTEVIYIGAGKALIADSKDPNGAWVWRTALTAKGIAGQEIVANSITANKLDADVGQSLDLSSNTSIGLIVSGKVEDYVQEHKDELKGDPGDDAEPNFTWIRFADTPTSGMSSLPAGKDYIGIAANKKTEIPSSNYSDYLWSLIRGPKGADGNDGNSNFTWIKYADDNKGAGMSDNPDGKRWLGVAANRDTSIESNDWNDYLWSPLYDNSVIISDTEPTNKNIAQLWLDTSVSPNLIKRWDGSKWETISDTTQLEELVASKASQEDLDGQIANVVASIQSSLESEISQTQETINFKFSEALTAIDEAGQRITDLSTELETNIRFTAEGIELGKSDNPVSVKILPDRVSFSEGGQEVAYFSNNKLYVTDIHVLTSLRIGDFAFFPRTSGNLSFKKVT